MLHAYRHALKTYEPRLSYPIELKRPVLEMAAASVMMPMCITIRTLFPFIWSSLWLCPTKAPTRNGSKTGAGTGRECRTDAL